MAPQKSTNKKPSKNLQKISKKPFKSKPKGKRNKLEDAVSSQERSSVALQLEDDVPDFPRGGGSILSRQEREEVRAEADAEFEAEERFLRKNKKQKGIQKRSAEEDDLGSLFGDAFTGKLPKFANKITLKNISPGMKLWGVIAEVNDKDIVVSLPGGLRGLVIASEAFDPVPENEINGEVESNFLSSVYYVGQLVSCIVLQLDDDKKEKGKRRIWLSLRLSLLHKSLGLDVIQEGMVLSAYVKSSEDHGYTVHFGLPSFTGFLSKGNQSESGNVKVGQLIQGLVKSIDKSRKLLYLNSDSGVVSKCVTKDLKGISIDLLVPGMMVDARVRSTLENGIMLSFLTYFTGTVDIFNLHETFPTSSWKDVYSQNKKVNARILFIDPTTRAVGLTLNSHLVRNRAPPMLVKTGDIFDKSKVIRVDRGLGLLLEIPSTPEPTPAYVNVTDVADKEVKKLEKTFKEGSHVRLRVLGFRHLEGLATATLKTSAFEGSIFTHSDVKPGMVVKAKIIAVDGFGAIVQFGSGVKALCPLRHMSEFEITKPRKKFQVGAELIFRVLGCKSKRITVTHKKTLVKSKLEILSSYADAVEGLLTHGWITKIENHGCFVRFYNGVQGFAPRYELGLDAGSDVSSMYHVEQVVKCRVTSSNPTARRINLSFTSKSRAPVDSAVNIGSLVSGVVERVTPHAVVIKLNAKGDIKGTISPEHLADHQGHASLLKSVLKPGYEFDQLLVLDMEGRNPVLTAKLSLVNSAQQLPSDIAQVCPHSVVHGYVCNLIETGCFVRFIGRLTGFAPKRKAVDDRQCDLSEVFYIGQSVRSSIVDVNHEMNRITLSLKQSLCSSTDASFIQEYFLLEDKIARLQLLDLPISELGWVNEFDVGTVVEGKVTETKDFGVVISFQKYKDIFGFISHYQSGGITVESGTTVQAMVLDVSKLDRLVDLSLKPEFVNRPTQEGPDNHQAPKKKRKRNPYKQLEVNQTVNAQVEIVKEDYLVLSLPMYNFALGYASVTDFNTQKAPRKQFVNGQSVAATVAALPSPSTGGRLLLLLKSISDDMDSSSSKRAKKKLSYNVGSLVEAEITEAKPFELRVKFGSGFHGRIHITEAADGNLSEDALSDYRVGQTQTARIVSKSNNKRGYQWELSMKPSLLTGSGEVEKMNLSEDFNYSIGGRVSGFVYKVDKEWAWLTVSRDVNARIYILDSACEPAELAEFQKRYYVGKAVSGYILQADKEKKLLRVVLHPFVDQTGPSNENTAFHIREGCAVGGRISKILPGVGGILVQIDQHLYGKVHFAELADPGVSDPLNGYQEGDFVKCEVLEISHSAKGTVHFDLSLRPSSNSMQITQFNNSVRVGKVMKPILSSFLTNSITHGNNVTSMLKNLGNCCIKRLEKIEDIRPDMVIQGYVKNASPKGCFIMISRKLDAKILLSNLSDGYIEDPEKEFPVGKLVTGKVLSVEPLSKRVEVTLRTSSAIKYSKYDINALDSLAIGDVITGRIRRVERYGLFVTIDNINVVGLCHVSELFEEHVDNIETKYKAGERVTAKVLKVDKEKNRVCLGMKSSYFDRNVDAHETSDTGSGNGTDVDQDFGAEAATLPLTEDIYMQAENEEIPILAELESRASIPPLHVPLDEIEVADTDNIANQGLQCSTGADIADGTSKKRAKKKAKEEREQEIRAAEERLLEKDTPRNADEFEKLVRSSPNSSFVWIKYMAFLLSLADVEKARSIAERALRTINIREESEKLNIWVAYFNLENEYGNPPEEAVTKLFHRALQYSDPKKVHLALLGMYERTEQLKLANKLLEKMVKKFKHSCKIWLRQIQSLLKQNNDGMQSVVNRALLCLPRHKHIKFISQTAILEFKCGVPDRGRSLFEGMLREYPKRTDLWSIYLDQEIRLGDEDVIRALFERAISLSLPPKKMKFLFKKYLEYEKSVGDEERIESVKRKAIEYVESSLA